MGKYFGTDGFRGEAGIDLTADHAYKVGRFLGWYYNALRERNGNKEPARIVIGKDTRRSSYMFEYSLVAGLTASGADAYLLHVTTTPSVAYIARVDDFDCGIMISASHNPYYDNGIKLIDCYGEKMPEETLLLVEDYIDGKLHVFDCLAVQFAKVRDKITEEQYSYYISELLTLPEKMQKTLEDKERIQWFAAKYANAHDVFFVGRGIDYAVGLEGSLKLKEISYIHSEAYAAGELKHGTISLIEQGTLVIGVLTQSELYEKTISNMLECKSRGAYLMGLTTYGKYEIEDQVNFTVYVPKVDEHFVGSLAVIPLQLLGYYVSVAKGLDVDKPRNLAKSVTVE